MKNKLISIFVMLMFLLSFPAVIAQNTTDAEVTADTEIQADVITTSEVSNTTETEVQDNTTEVEVEEQEAPQTETQVEAEVEQEAEAADSGEVGNATQEEVKIMTDAPGAKVRLLQLQERLERNIANGEDIIAAVSNGTDVSKLQSILDQLKVLKDEVAAIDPSTVSIQDATAQFVAIKQKAIKLSKEFRTEARKLVKANRIAALKEKLKAKEANRLANIKGKVKDARDEHNAQVFADILSGFGERLPAVVEQLKNGEITVKEAKQIIRQEFQKLSKDKKDKARLKLKEKVSKERVKRLESRQELRQKGLRNALDRIEKRLAVKEREGLVKARETIKSKIEAKGNETEDGNTSDSNESED